MSRDGWLPPGVEYGDIPGNEPDRMLALAESLAEVVGAALVDIETRHRRDPEGLLATIVGELRSSIEDRSTMIDALSDTVVAIAISIGADAVLESKPWES